MPTALFILLLCQLAGEVARAVFHLPVPGPVIGMFLLTAALACRPRARPAEHQTASLHRTAEALISHMGLLFVPAGVGVIAEISLLQEQWLPIVAALAGSTAIGLLVTGLAMHWTSGRTSRATNACAARLPPALPALEARS